MVKQSLYKLYTSIKIDGIVYDGNEAIQSYCDELISTGDEEKRAIANFLKQWFSEVEYITLKTSGSTGKPKDITVKKEAMVASARRTVSFLKLKEGSSALLCLSANYIAGKMMIVRALVGKLNLLISNVSSNPLSEIAGHIDFAAMVPLQVTTCLHDNPDVLNKIKTLIIGGGRVNPQLSDQLSVLECKTWETYGMTETVSHIAMRQINSRQKCFQLLPGINVVSDERSCLVVEPSEVNESQVVTNDVVEMCSPSSFLIKGRFDNIINTGGIKVIAEEIEAKLSKLDMPFAISYREDLALGQRIVLVLQSSSSISIDEIDCSYLSKFERPKEVVCIKELPKTANGKIQRKKLRELITK
ncbi:AMP-binding protein [Carboxylicivirga marina]|uniref:AMP-binding protein n=1 Tax=Carboxylicivirga marina TaxID=2800988 RepID=A0ABS1HML5_9BACT|nr:AMP-binding protein [Carboxylicivirga marina]MBK3518503.1 AMP-binding protein [Carboxylicivirga marina]